MGVGEFSHRILQFFSRVRFLDQLVEVPFLNLFPLPMHSLSLLPALWCLSSLNFSMLLLVAERNLSWFMISEVFAFTDASDISLCVLLIACLYFSDTCLRCSMKQQCKFSWAPWRITLKFCSTLLSCLLKATQVFCIARPLGVILLFQRLCRKFSCMAAL